MAIWSRLCVLFYPLLKTRMQRELDEARHELLTAQNHLDYYQAMVTYYQVRIDRLQGDLNV